jgi:uncharacterized radical SAM superfamily protein
MSKNKKVMSIAIRPDLHDELKRFSKRKGLSASTYIGNLVEQAVKLNIDDDPMVIGKPVDDEVVPVVLKIPAALKNYPDKLKQWMDVQSNGIVKAMTKHLLPDPSKPVEP